MISYQSSGPASPARKQNPSLKVFSGLCLSILLTACAPQSEEGKTSSKQAEAPASAATSSAETASPAPVASLAPRQAPGGRVSFLDGPAEVFSEKEHHPLKMEQILSPGQTVQTGSKTRLELTFADGSRLRISPAAHVRFAYQSADNNALFQVDQGEIWGNVRPGARKLVFQGKHSTATVLGTVYNLDVTAERTCTRVIHGKVGIHMPFAVDGHASEVVDQAPKRLNSEQDNSGLKPFKEGDVVVPSDEWMQLSTNQCIVVKDKGKAHVMIIDIDELAKKAAWLKWNRERDKSLPPH